MGKKASGGGKKKGPKGKKARAKAKLERQWGEELTEEQLAEARKHRRGTTVKQPATNTGVTSQPKLHHVNLNLPTLLGKPLENDESDEDEEVGDQGNSSGNALNALLQSIQHQNRRKAIEQDDISENGELENKGKAQVTGNESEDDDDGLLGQDISLSEENCDLFGLHFNRPPFPATKLNSPETMTKISMDSIEDSIEMHVSSQIIDEMKALSGTQQATNKTAAEGSDLNWKRLAKRSFSGVRKSLSRSWQGTGAPQAGNSKLPLAPLQKVLLPCLTQYADVLMAAESPDNREQVSSVLRLHVLNHVLHSRSRIQRHNHRLRELAKQDESAGLEGQGKFRDQGYTRATVLILLPTRGTCYSFVKGLLGLLGESHHHHHEVDDLDRFEAEFGAPPLTPQPAPLNEDNQDVAAAAAAAERRRKMVLEKKGKEWLELFGDDVNDDDDFKIGISLTPKAAMKSSKQKQDGSSKPSSNNNSNYEYTNVAMKLFTDFYKSDIILASPLALKLLSATSDSDDADYDFLSSIEICILARMDVLLMQNMDHVNSVLSLLNQQPKRNNSDIDFSRVREYFLVGQAAQWRQLVICSNITDPQILSVFKRHAKSYQGSVKMKRIVSSDDCFIGKVVLPIRQVFQRVPCSSLADQGDAKLKYLMEKVLPPMLQRKQKHTMIFIPSYFDFIALRNTLLKREVDFVTVSEYSRVTEVTRSRARFLQGLKPILLYTGRAHYFHRHTIKGVKHIIFMGLPEQSAFYIDLIHALGAGLQTNNTYSSTNKQQEPQNHHLLETTTTSTCLALFTKYDAHALERIAGKEDCRKMLKSDKTAFAFASS